MLWREKKGPVQCIIYVYAKANEKNFQHMKNQSTKMLDAKSHFGIPVTLYWNIAHTHTRKYISNNWKERNE